MGLKPGPAVNQREDRKMNQTQLMNLAIAGGIIFAAYRWGNATVKGAAISIAAVVAAKQVPYVKDYV